MFKSQKDSVRTRAWNQLLDILSWFSDPQKTSILVLDESNAKKIDQLIDYFDLLELHYLGIESLEKKRQFIPKTTYVYLIDPTIVSM